MDRIGVMHVTNTLNFGGYERVAVNMVNLLPRSRYVAHLCTTYREGPLADVVAEHVCRIDLNLKWRFDFGAMRRLVTFIKIHNIQILHVHGNSLFITSIASLFLPHVAVLWHDHYGQYATKGRPVWLHRLIARRFSAIIAVNQALAEWSHRRLGVPPERIWYIPNFASVAQMIDKPPTLPGTPGGRIVCVANFRAQKDHLTLLRAMALVIRYAPAAHLLLVGAKGEKAYFDLVHKEIVLLGLSQNVSILGERKDVSAILQGSDVGVLSSASEGFPLALLEYGMARLPAVATRVGQCAELLDDGRAGILVPSGSHEKLAQALLSLLQSSERRSVLGRQFHRRVEELYSPDSIMRQVCQVYETVLSSRKRVH